MAGVGRKAGAVSIRRAARAAREAVPRNMLIVRNKPMKGNVELIRKMITRYSPEKYKIEEADHDKIRLGRISPLNTAAIALSGGGVMAASDGEGGVRADADFSREVELIKRAGVPIFGICAGFELIALVYGHRLLELGEKVDRIYPGIEVVRPEDPIFEGAGGIDTLRAAPVRSAATAAPPLPPLG